MAIFAVALHLTAPKPPSPALISKTTAAVVNTVAKSQAKEDQEHAQAKEVISHVKAASNASATAGPAGHSGLVGLCSLATYAQDPVCKLLRNDPGQPQEASEASDPTGR